MAGAKGQVEIAGAGLSGLAAATAFARAGWNVRLHERNDQLREIGAGIFMWENGLRVLEAIGAYDEATAGGERDEYWEILDERERYALLKTIVVQQVINRHNSPRNRVCHMTAGREPGRSNGAPAAPWHGKSQMPEFANLIGSTKPLSKIRSRRNYGRKEFSWLRRGSTVSQPPGVAYTLTLCHYADFLDRFGWVTFGQVKRNSVDLKNLAKLKKHV